MKKYAIMFSKKNRSQEIETRIQKNQKIKENRKYLKDIEK